MIPISITYIVLFSFTQIISKQVDKVWIQCDETEEGIATDLMEAGISKEDIVLGFRYPKVRKYTGFAVA